MEVNLSYSSVGLGQLWNHCNKRHCLMGLVCKAAGVEDHEMDYRKSLVFKGQEKRDAKGKVIEVEPSRAIPEEISAFFTEDETWAERTKMKGSRRYVLNELGLGVAALSDSGPGHLPEPMWQAKILEILAKGNVQAVWDNGESKDVQDA